MTIESQLRQEILKVLNKTDQIIHKKEREEILWDLLHYTAQKLDVELKIAE